MKVSSLFLFVFFISAIAWSESTIFGTWSIGGYHFRAARISYNHEMVIEADRITMITYCRFNQVKLKAEVSSPIKISGNKIAILSSPQYQVAEGDFACKAELQAQEFSYKLVEGGSKAKFIPMLGAVQAVRVTHQR